MVCLIDDTSIHNFFVKMYVIRQGNAILLWKWIVFLKSISRERVFSLGFCPNLGRLSSSFCHISYRTHQGLILFKKEFIQNFTKADVKLGGLRKDKVKGKDMKAGCDGVGKFVMTAWKNIKRS